MKNFFETLGYVAFALVIIGTGVLGAIFLEIEAERLLNTWM